MSSEEIINTEREEVRIESAIIYSITLSTPIEQNIFDTDRYTNFIQISLTNVIRPETVYSQILASTVSIKSIKYVISDIDNFSRISVSNNIKVTNNSHMLIPTIATVAATHTNTVTVVEEMSTIGLDIKFAKDKSIEVTRKSSDFASSINIVATESIRMNKSFTSFLVDSNVDMIVNKFNEKVNKTSTSRSILSILSTNILMALGVNLITGLDTNIKITQRPKIYVDQIQTTTSIVSVKYSTNKLNYTELITSISSSTLMILTTKKMKVFELHMMPDLELDVETTHRFTTNIDEFTLIKANFLKSSEHETLTEEIDIRVKYGAVSSRTVNVANIPMCSTLIANWVKVIASPLSSTTLTKQVLVADANMIYSSIIGREESRLVLDGF